MSQQYQPKNYLPFVDGLRALAVILVLLFHLDISLIKGGFIGVDIFFVISGFLITKIIAREMERGSFSFANFYARRIRRIFPALFTMLFFSAIAAIIFLPPEQYSNHLEALRMASGQISNFFFMKELDYFDLSGENPALLHTWSLGVEEQFYLIWPLLLLAIYKLWDIKHAYIPIIIIGIISLGVSEYLLRVDAMQSFYMLYSRAWELAIGGLVALKTFPEIKKKPYINAISVAGLGLILYAALFLDKNNFPGLNALFPVIGAAMIIYGGINNNVGAVHRILSLKPVVFVGLISYSLYLWHWPLIIFYKGYWGSDLDVTAQVGIALASVVLAYLSYHFVEQPFRKGGYTPAKVIIVGLLVIVISIVSSNLLKKHRLASWRITETLDEQATRPNKWVKKCSAEGGAYFSECIIGANRDNYEVILVGDSHASHFIPMVLEWAKDEGLTVRLFMRGACKTWIDDNKIRKNNGKIDKYCMDLSANFFKTLEEDKHIKYVFLAQRFPKGTEQERKSLLRVKSYGKNVIFLGATPEFKEEPNHCFVKNHLLITGIFPRENSKGKCFELDNEYSDKLLEKVDNEFIPMLGDLGIPYFNPRSYITSGKDDKGNLIYLDNNHLNIYGAQFLTPYFIEFMDRNSVANTQE